METKAKADDPVLLCLSPTRELAVQVENEAHKFGASPVSTTRVHSVSEVSPRVAA